MSIPSGRSETATMTVELPDPLIEEVDRLAELHGVSREGILRVAVRMVIGEYGNGEVGP